MRTVKEVMTTECVTVSTKDNIYEIAEKMKEHDVGFIPVVDGKKLVGVVTDRDLVIRGYAERKPGSTAVSEVISTDILTISPDKTVDQAAAEMATQQVRRLLVVEDGHLQGVIALGDLAIRNKFEDEAGEALSKISVPTK